MRHQLPMNGHTMYTITSVSPKTHKEVISRRSGRSGFTQGHDDAIIRIRLFSMGLQQQLRVCIMRALWQRENREAYTYSRHTRSRVRQQGYERVGRPTVECDVG